MAFKPKAPVQKDKIAVYNGNPKLKAAYQDIDFTTNQMRELLKCRKDIVYFAETYCKIMNVDKGLVNFEPYDYQKKLLKHMQTNRFSIIKTGRQMGKCVSINTSVTIRKKPTSWFKRFLIFILRGSINEIV